MAMPRANYNFKIDGVDIETILAQRNFKLGQQDRIAYLNSILYDENGKLIPYLTMFFDDDIMDDPMDVLKPTSTKPLSHDINVCKGLESLANYILYSPDGERITKKTEYNFYTDKDAFAKLQREQRFNFDQDFSVDKALDVLLDDSHNFLCETSQKIYKADIKKHKEIAQIQETIDYYVSLIKTIPNESQRMKERHKLGKFISEMRKEQCLIKSSLCGTIIFKHVSSNGEKITEPEVNGFNFDSVRKMFESCNPKHLTMLGELGDVFQDILDNIEVTEDEKLVLSFINDENKPNYAEIARTTGINKNTIYTRLNSLRNKIVKEYMRRYEDEYYLSCDYGWYRTCPICGEVKLISGYYFRKDPSSNDGFQSICKKCK